MHALYLNILLKCLNPPLPPTSFPFKQIYFITIHSTTHSPEKPIAYQLSSLGSLQKLLMCICTYNN
jgi:hypothetical protein